MNQMKDTSISLRTCLFDPIPEIFEAARYLDDAVSAHLEDNRTLAEKLIRKADMPIILEWCEAFWGSGGPFSRPLPVDAPARIPEEQRVKKGVTAATARMIISRDGYHCRFCKIPLIRGETRRRIQSQYPEVLRWGGGNPQKHTAFQAMEMNFDHLMPRARGGSREVENMIATCAPCNCGRMELTLEQVGLSIPRPRGDSNSTWDGLERFRS